MKNIQNIIQLKISKLIESPLHTLAGYNIQRPAWGKISKIRSSVGNMMWLKVKHPMYSNFKKNK